MSNHNTLKLGDWNILCDVCGFKLKASESQERWDGLRVCSKDWEPRHPMYFMRAGRPQKALPFTRPEGADVSCGPTYIAPSVGHQENTVPTGTFNTTNTVT